MEAQMKKRQGVGIYYNGCCHCNISLIFVTRFSNIMQPYLTVFFLVDLEAPTIFPSAVAGFPEVFLKKSIPTSATVFHGVFRVLVFHYTLRYTYRPKR